MPNHVEYDPGVPTFKHSDKFEAKSLVREMQREAAQAERAWEERCSQRDNNKQFFQNLNREEAALDLKLRISHFKNREPAQFTITEHGEKMGTALLNTYNADLGSRNYGMKELRRLERVKARTEKKIEKAMAKKNKRETVASWPPPNPDGQEASEKTKEEESAKESIASFEDDKEDQSLKNLPTALAKRLAARKNFRKRRISDSEKKPSIPDGFDPSKAEAAAQAAMVAFDFSTVGLDASKLTKLMNEPEEKEEKRPAKKLATSLEKKEKLGSFVNMPSEEPLNIPGLPIGWKFGDPMPEGTPVEEEKPPENQNPLEVVSKATNAKKKRRPKQPLIFEADAMGALVDPSRFTSKNHIEQKNLTPRVRLSDAKQEEKNSAPPPPQSTTPKVIVAPAIKRSTNTYSEADFVTSYTAKPSHTNYGGQARTYGTYNASDLTISQGRNKYNRYKGGGVGGGGYR